MYKKKVGKSEKNWRKSHQHTTQRSCIKTERHIYNCTFYTGRWSMRSIWAARTCQLERMPSTVAGSSCPPHLSSPDARLKRSEASKIELTRHLTSRPASFSPSLSLSHTVVVLLHSNIQSRGLSSFDWSAFFLPSWAHLPSTCRPSTVPHFRSRVLLPINLRRWYPSLAPFLDRLIVQFLWLLPC